MAYNMKGKYPSILKDKVMGASASALQKDAEAFLNKVIEENI